jgi:hypothetical protein
MYRRRGDLAHCLEPTGDVHGVQPMHIQRHTFRMAGWLPEPNVWYILPASIGSYSHGDVHRFFKFHLLTKEPR